MATYAVGDIQGCFATFERLLARIDFRPAQDRLWLVGDLVNRGPHSLKTLRWIVAHRQCIVAVLGNHDLYLLACHVGATARRGSDTLSEILDAPDRDALLSWLIERPLIYSRGLHDPLLVHAGLLPRWTRDDALRAGTDAHAALMRHPRRFLSDLFARHGAARTRTPAELLDATDTLTRIRMVDAAGTMAARYSGPPEQAPDGLVPWFAHPTRAAAAAPVVFGHWAALGLVITPTLAALDSGCVWGGALTALRLEDRAVFSVPSIQRPAARPRGRRAR